jgi:hypothetical protein
MLYTIVCKLRLCGMHRWGMASVGEYLRGALRGIITVCVLLVAIAAVAEVTGISERRDVTKFVAESFATRVPTVAPVPTQTPVPTRTPVPTKTPDELKREAEYLDPRLLESDPAGRAGANVVLAGEARVVQQAVDYTWVYLDAGVRDRPLTQPIVITLRPPDRDLLSSECYRFYGITAGETDADFDEADAIGHEPSISIGFTIEFGDGERPLVEAYAVEPSEREDSGNCGA